MKLLIFTFSPVQGFISASRRPRDLFTASYILSFLIEKLIKELKLENKVIYPVVKNHSDGLANYPNRFIAEVEEDMCEKAKSKFKEIWKEICENVWNSLNLKVDDEVKKQFNRHVENYFNVFCECIDFIDEEEWREKLGINEEIEADNYGFTYDYLERLLGAKKSWRPYRSLIDNLQYDYKTEGGEKKGRFPDGCTMCGERHFLAFDWRNKKVFKEEDARHIRPGEKLCGVCLVKRFAVKYYFEDKFKYDLWHFPSTEEIAGIKFKEALAQRIKDENFRKSLRDIYEKIKDTPYEVRTPVIKKERHKELNIDAELFRKEGWKSLFNDMEDILGKEKTEEIKKLLEKVQRDLNLNHKNPYYAILVSDGDSIGEWLGIKSEIRNGKLTKDFHRKFSETLSEYAKDVTKIQVPKCSIYAGGDDIMVLLHPFDAMFYAKGCADNFYIKFKPFARADKEPSVSSGILITHAKMSLQKALEEARNLEKEAKSIEGKGAVCVGVLTRSGNMTYFISMWKDLKLYNELVIAFREGKVGSSLAYEFRSFGESLKGDFQREVFLSLLKRALKRRVEDSWEKFYTLMECFFNSSLDYGKDVKFALNNLLNLIYVARFVGTMEEL